MSISSKYILKDKKQCILCLNESQELGTEFFIWCRMLDLIVIYFAFHLSCNFFFSLFIYLLIDWSINFYVYHIFKGKVGSKLVKNKLLCTKSVWWQKLLLSLFRFIFHFFNPWKRRKPGHWSDMGRWHCFDPGESDSFLCWLEYDIEIWNISKSISENTRCSCLKVFR